MHAAAARGERETTGRARSCAALLAVRVGEPNRSLEGAAPHQAQAAHTSATVPVHPPTHPPSPSPSDPEDPMRVTDQSRALGLIVCRGTSVMLVVPTAGTEEIANPFQAEGMEA